MKVLCSEGLASHTGPEPCVGPREGPGEASAGERAGRPSSRERATVPGADVVTVTEGHTNGRVSASARRPGVVRDPGMHGRSLRGNREVSRLAVGPCRRSASGRRGAVAGDARAREVRPRHSSDEADEQGWATSGGAGGAKGGGQGKRGPAKHAPGAGPDKRVPGAGPRATSREAEEEGTVHRALPPSAALRRQAPEVGAVCGKPARTVLCGGRPVMGVPTAIPAVLLPGSRGSPGWRAGSGSRGARAGDHRSRAIRGYCKSSRKECQPGHCSSRSDCQPKRPSVRKPELR